MVSETPDMPSMRSDNVLETKENKASRTNLDSGQKPDNNTVTHGHWTQTSQVVYTDNNLRK